MFVLFFFPFTEVLSERKWGRGGVVGEGVRLSFVIGWLFLFVFSFVGEFWIKKRLTIFRKGIGVLSCGYFWLSFALFLHIRLPPPPPPPPPPLSLPNADAEIRGQSEHTLSSEGLLQKQLFVRVWRSRALSSVQILAK